MSFQFRMVCPRCDNCPDVWNCPCGEVSAIGPPAHSDFDPSPSILSSDNCPNGSWYRLPSRPLNHGGASRGRSGGPCRYGDSCRNPQCTFNHPSFPGSLADNWKFKAMENAQMWAAQKHGHR